MKIQDLIDLLKGCDPEGLVVMSSDGEGNMYSPLSGADTKMAYVAENERFGHVRFTALTDELRKRGYSEGDCVQEGETAVPCIIFYPNT